MFSKLRIQANDLIQELNFTASRSSGPGGQNVNKVSTKITLKFDVVNSSILSEEQKQLLLDKWRNKLTKDGVLLLSAQDSRSQQQNKEEAVAKFDQLLRSAFTIPKARKATKPSKTAQQKRIAEKKQRGEKKQWRQKL